MQTPAYTAEFVERGYNNRLAVPDHPQWFEKWAAWSARARDSLHPALDVRYGPNPKETLDLFVPQRPPRTTLVFVHGGYWRALDKAEHHFVAPVFVERGHAVAVVNYDLCPAVTIAVIVDEIRRAVAWIARDGGRHGAGVERIVVAGHSAGGHLAAMMIATRAEAFGLARHPVHAAVSVSGVHDLRPLTLFSFNSDLRLDDDEAARLSPSLHAPQSRAPIAIAVGGDETSEFLRQATLLWDAWPDNRPPGVAGPILVHGRHHFSVLADYADPASALTRSTLAALEG